MSDHAAYVAGLLKYSPDITFFLAPYINSYKRFLPGTFAPTKIAWSVDNRTAGYRLVGDGTKGVRIECRIGGLGHEPLPRLRRQLAAGHRRHRGGAELPPPVTGDVYGMDDIAALPHTLRAATETLRGSAMLRAAMGDDVVDHYTRAAEVEQEAFDAASPIGKSRAALRGPETWPDVDLISPIDGSVYLEPRGASRRRRAGGAPPRRAARRPPGRPARWQERIALVLRRPTRSSAR
jgi:hypothetical protein